MAHPLQSSIKFINHTLLKKDKLMKRAYQTNIFVTCSKANTLVVIPTGLGKTIIAMLMVLHRLTEFPHSKIIFLAPTRPLVEQHYRTFQDLLEMVPDRLVIMTGHSQPEKRQRQYEQATCLFMTPQVLQNDLIANRFDMKEVSLCIFDEAHRATGDYAYSYLAKKYTAQAQHQRILAITASPGKNREKIMEVMENLSLKAVEIRTESDPDVKPYIQDVEVIWKDVELPAELLEIHKIFQEMQKTIYKELNQSDLIDSASPDGVSRKDLLVASTKLDNLILKNQNNPELSHLFMLKKYLANAVRISHMAELLEAQGLQSLSSYLEKNKESIEKRAAGKSLKELFLSKPMQRVFDLLEKLASTHIDHPKIALLMSILLENFRSKQESRVLVFCHFRDTVKHLVAELNKSDLIHAERFIGQQKKGNEKGFSQKEQLLILQQFKSGEINTLVATSVAEEGLDISECDVVIFYDVVPSEIRAIQRRGRTGRNREGKVYILKTKGTREEAYFWAEKIREKEMKRILGELQRELKLKQPAAEIPAPKGQKNLNAFISPQTDSEEPSFIESDQNLKQNQQEPSENDTVGPIEFKPVGHSKGPFIMVDSRETASPVSRELSEMNANLSLQKLPTGDYIVSERCGVERKAVQDFVDSLKDGRLFNELQRLRNQFPLPILVVEGDMRKAISVNRAALLGALTSIVLNMGVTLYQTMTPQETAEFIYALAKKDQEGSEKKAFSIRFRKAPDRIADQLEYIVSGIPGINATRAQDLLREFRTVQALFTASEEQLKQTPNIGPVLAKNIRKYATIDYFTDQKPKTTPSSDSPPEENADMGK